MNEALMLFLKTLAIIGGILSPIFLFLTLQIILVTIKNNKKRNELLLEELKRRNPFDKIELYKVPNDTMIGIRFYKMGEVVCDQSIDKPKFNLKVY